jgi:hippurate hydrolase
MRTSATLPLLAMLLTSSALYAQSTKDISYDLSRRKALVVKQLDGEYKSLESLYKQLHAYPELSYEEEKTAARLAKELKTLGSK